LPGTARHKFDPDRAASSALHYPRDRLGPIAGSSILRWKVRPWDFKQKNPHYQDYGNFSFGATGYGFGFAENVLLREAGRANQVADPRRANTGLGDPGPRWYPFGGTPPFGDDPEDQEQIKNGVKYCKCKLGIK
jgi:hypothetical protein